MNFITELIACLLEPIDAQFAIELIIILAICRFIEAIVCYFKNRNKPTEPYIKDDILYF